MAAMRLAIQWLAFASMAVSVDANAAAVGSGASTGLNQGIATATYAFSDTDWAALQESCGPVTDWALDAAKEALGYVAGAAQDFARSLCFPLNSTMCDLSDVCTYCNSNTTCWPMVDVDNPCHALAVKALVAGAYVGGEVAKGLAAAGQWATSQCMLYNTSTSCIGQFGLFCDWCETPDPSTGVKTCYTKGSVLNPCLREEMLILAAETGSDVANQVSAASKAKWESQKVFCAGFNGNQTYCSQQVQCTWCGTAGSTAVNVCYFMGDTDNKCMKATIQPFIDAKGEVMPIASWIGNASGQAYQDLSKWGNNLCGQHTTKAPCDVDSNCYFCDTDNLCYVYGSVNSPCGNWQKTTQQLTDEWNNQIAAWTGESQEAGCTKEQKTAHQKLKDGVNIAMANLNETCKMFVKTNFYASRSMASLQKDLGNATAAASSLAGTQIARAKQSAKDAWISRNESKLKSSALAAFEAANPCVADGSEAASEARFSCGYLGVPAALILSFLLG